MYPESGAYTLNNIIKTTYNRIHILMNKAILESLHYQDDS